MTNIPEIELVRDEVTGELIPEIWKPIPDYEGFYEASTYGRIKSFHRNYRGHILVPAIHPTGYYYVALTLKMKLRSFAIHQLVAMTFLNHRRCGYQMVVNHKDLNKLNNYVGNLELVTQRENSNKKHIKSISSFVGVSLDSRRNKKWRAHIWINKRVKYIGSFYTEIEASNAYQEALSKHLAEKTLANDTKNPYVCLVNFCIYKWQTIS